MPQEPDASATRRKLLASPGFFLALATAMCLLGFYGGRLHLAMGMIVAAPVVSAVGCVISAYRWKTLTLPGKIAAMCLGGFTVVVIGLLVPSL